jgi:iron complex outermembrane recepter protein
MKWTRNLSMVILIMALAAAAFAQGTAGVLNGTVTTAGAPLAGVLVTVTSPSLASPLSVRTDSGGNYSFDNLPAGNYTVRFELQGLQSVTRTAQVAAGATARADADLRVPAAAYAEEVTVTGSLIPRPTLEAMSPVATLDVAELSYSGATRLEDFLTNLPQVFASQNSTIANGASGTATVDLRYLGADRTLVLVDGKRLPSGDRFAISPDLNFIPAALVKRVDVLTGGASAVYGADAVAGVVNFILDTEFEGVRGGISGGIYQHDNSNALAQRINAARGFTAPSGSTWDGGQFEAFLALGGKFGEDRGHASVYVDYRKADALTKDARDYTNCSVNSLGATGPACGGSSTSPTGRFLTADGGDYTLDVSGSGNTFTNFGAAHLFNFAPYNYMQRPDERWTAGGFLNYEWSDRAVGYGSFMLMDDRTDAQIAPSGNFFSTDTINCDNPMLSADQRQKICTNAGYGPTDMAEVYIGRRNVEGGGRMDLLSHQAFRLVGGLRGTLSPAWSYDVYGLTGQTRVPEEYTNDFHSGRIQDALIVDGDPNNPSTWRCRSGNAGCVPWNIFRAGGVTQEALNYLQIPLVSNTKLETQLVSARMTAHLREYGLTLPSAAEGISIAIGAEYREEMLAFRPDLAYQEGLGAGQGGPTVPVEGSYHVAEAYTELLIPIVQGARGVRDLSMELGYRTSDYSTSGRFPTYKAQLAYSPTSDVKFRTGYNRATRAPNIVELFRPQGIILGGDEDICAGANPSYTQEQCARTGVTPAQYGNILINPAQQYNALAGGNPNLDPEIADTMTFGIVLTPRGIPNLVLALDYYDIQLKDTIGTLGADQVIRACAESGDPQLCGLIHRDALGTLWLTPQGYTETTNQNIGELRAEGLDVNLSYMQPLGASSINFGLIGTYLMQSFVDTGLYAYDCVGYMGNQCGQPSPKWRHLARLGWQAGPATVTLGWRMVGEALVDAASPEPALADPGRIPRWQANNSYKHNAFHYFDIATSYALASSVNFTLGVNNLADKEPPLGSGFSDVDYGPGFYGTYDPYGRYVHASITFNLR